MLTKYGYRDFHRRRRRSRTWQFIVLLLVAGLGLISAALYQRKDDAKERPEFAPIRSIDFHQSSAQNPSQPEPIQAQVHEAKAEQAQPLGPSQSAPSVQNTMPSNAAQVQRDADALEATRRAGQALLRLEPQSPGALLPSPARYRVTESKIVYDASVAPAVIAAAHAKTYTIVSGDILGRIAQKHGCSIEQIKTANRLKDDKIRIGQKLMIPDCQGEVIPLVEENKAAEEKAAVATRGRWWKAVGVNTTALPKLMQDNGFKPPARFMAFVLELTFDATRQVIVRERAFDYKGSSSKSDGWNPASSVKVFAAIGALHRLEELGFTSRAQVTFHSAKPYTTTVSSLIEAAIIQSDNIAYNRVVQLASFEKLHKEILTQRYGIARTALNRAYEITRWKDQLGENPSLRVAPAISLKEGKKSYKIEASHSKVASACSSAACTTLQDLAESTRRLMLQEQLPAKESFNLKNEDLLMLRRAMRSEERQRGTEVVDIFAKHFGDSRVRFYAKPGFAEDWFTDNIYIFDPRHNQAWIVVMSAHPGRNALNAAAHSIAKIISSGQLRKLP